MPWSDVVAEGLTHNPLVEILSSLAEGAGQMGFGTSLQTRDRILLTNLFLRSLSEFHLVARSQ